MGIKKSRGSRFRAVTSSFRMAESGIKTAKSAIRKDQEEREEDNLSFPDPSLFLTRKEKKAWDRLSASKKQNYVRRAIRKAEKQDVRKGNLSPGPVGKKTAEEWKKKEKDRKDLLVQRKQKEKSRQEEKERGERKGTSFGGTPETLKAKETSGKNRSASPDSTAMPLPAEVAVLAAKKTAEQFKEQNRRKNRVIEGRRMQLQSELYQKMEENRGMGTPGQTAAFATAALSSAMLVIATAAIQIITTFFIMILAVLFPVIVIAIVVSVVAAFIAGVIAALSTTYASGSGEDIVAVAIQEIGYQEEAGNVTKYGAFTGADGLAWCHSFVSWCANECGFIRMGILPKTASCEEGRQWFIRHQKYQKKDASYLPQPGDILYFDYEGAGESHHVGIVEYTENGVVHTIEGNKRDQVMRAHYPLTYAGIMGYGQPDYPENGIDAYGSAEQFLEECARVSSVILNDGNWVYSNSHLEDSREKARKADVRKTNCAHYVSLVMQEFGTLKEGQFIYSNAENQLVASSRVRNQLEKYYEILSIGGKMPEEVGLKPGDICLFHLHTNVYAGKNSAGKMTWYDYSRSQTSDGKENSGYFVKGTKTGNTVGGKIYTILRLKDQDAYGTGKTITLPRGLGDVYSYMGWSMTTNRLSRQYRLRVGSGEKYDANGFGKIGDRYVVACTSTFGQVGDEVDFVLANGRVIHGVIGDQKNQADSDCDKWGHQHGHCVVEFCVNKAAWYGTGKTVTRYHPEWAGTTVVKAVNLGKNHLK